MAGIPPGWLGSIIQTQGAAQRTGEKKAKEDSSAVENAGAGSFADKLQNVVGASDRDNQVYADAEGAGSQGSPFEEGGAEQESGAETNADEAGSSGLDVEA
jgi:hypothetical protein